MSKKRDLSFDPNYLSQQGIKFLNEGNFEKSKEIFNQLIIHFSNNVELLNLLGFVNLQLNCHEESFSVYSKSIEINPHQVEVFFNRAIVSAKLKKFPEAIKDYDVVISHNPKNIDALINQSAVYQDMQNFEEGLRTINIALSYDPNNYKALSNRGNLFQSLYRYEDAIHDFDMAIKLEPSIIGTYVNRSNSLKFLGRLSEAAKSLDAALAIDKNNANAQFHYSILLLSQKRFSEGWEKYKYRWKAMNLKQPKFVEDLPSFSITEKHGKLLVWCEQGIGDQIFFGSILRDLPKNLVVEVLINPKLIDLFKLSFPHISFISSQSNIEISSYDFQIGLVELASLYRNSKDDLNKLPSRFIITNDVKNNVFKKILQKNKKFTCGISWKSKNNINGYARSISLESLLPILQTQGLSFVNLQYGDTTADANYLKDNYDINFEDIGSVDNYNDLDSLASLIESCDFIITIDNSTVHLAGSMGKKTYLLLPYGLGSIWYWHDDNQSIWYPSVEIFRQKEPQDWCGVTEDILRKIRIQKIVG